MLLTEEEARTKWCPHSRVVPAIMRNGYMVSAADAPAHNRVQEQGIPDNEQPTTHAAMNCIASACMAWRWAEAANEEAQMAFEAACPTGASLGCEVVGPFPVGYCGLAGTPSHESA